MASRINIIHINSLFSSNETHLIITSKSHQYFTSFKPSNHRKINYGASSQPSSSRSAIVACLPSSNSDANITVDVEDNIPRPITKTFQRSPWAKDTFSSEYYNDDDDQIQENYAQEIESMKEKVRNMITDEKHYTSRDKMVLIDTLERLDIAYHFEQEIEAQIEKNFESYSQDEENGESDLFTTALYFRVFRQHGYGVSCRVFNKFKDEGNTFKNIYCIDFEGLLSLYEASFLRFREEIELQEARDFATHHLNKANRYLLEAHSYLKEKVNRALQHPIHWALPKLEARYYISIYEKRESKDENLLRLAKLDFNVMQSMYRKEMHEVQKWWYGFELVFRLPYARDCVVTSYIWCLGLNFEPKYARSRIAASKLLVLVAFLNDTYDSYATLEELQVFTDILQRWDTKDDDIIKLPEYLKLVYNVLVTVCNEFERETSEQGRSYTVPYLREIFSRVASAYYKKAKWFNGKEIPTFQDHVDHMGITSGAHYMLAAYYMHVESASKDTFEWLINKPTSVESAALYCRYHNDISTYEREHEAGKYPAAVDSYMEENGVSVQETKETFAELAEDCWMILNKEWIESKCVPKDILKPVVNFCRIVFATYEYGVDLYTSPEEGFEASIDALLVDPLVI